MLVSQTGLLLSICSSGSMSSGKTQSYRAKGSGSHCKHNWLMELAIYRPATPLVATSTPRDAHGYSLTSSVGGLHWGPLMWIHFLTYSGWWFGWFLFHPYIGNNFPNWRTHIFQGHRYTTNQYLVDYVARSVMLPGWWKINVTYQLVSQAVQWDGIMW